MLFAVTLARADSTNTPSIARDSRYPAHWWTPVAKEGAPAWEILPQEAGPGEVILSKRNELGLLSNFAPTAFTFHGKRYASLEGFWQMMNIRRMPTIPARSFPLSNGSTHASKSPSLLGSMRAMPATRPTRT